MDELVLAAGLDITICDLQFSNSSLESWKAKSFGKRSILRRTAWLSALVVPRAARPDRHLSMTFCPWMRWMWRSIAAGGTPDMGVRARHGTGQGLWRHSQALREALVISVNPRTICVASVAPVGDQPENRCALGCPAVPPARKLILWRSRLRKRPST